MVRQVAEVVHLHRFYPLLDTAILATSGVEPVAAARSLLDAGAAILQLRHKGHWSPEVFETAKIVADLCGHRGCTLVVNDRADIALLLKAAVHVGQEDLPPSDVRRIVPAGTVIGYSTHNEAQLRQADTEPADYLALGPIFSTSSKENPDPVVGIEELRRLRALTAKPLVAIGGIRRQNAYQVWDAGADSIAVVADLYPPGCGPKQIRESAEEWIRLANEYSAK